MSAHERAPTMLILVLQPTPDSLRQTDLNHILTLSHENHFCKPFQLPSPSLIMALSVHLIMHLDDFHPGRLMITFRPHHIHTVESSVDECHAHASPAKLLCVLTY